MLQHVQPLGSFPFHAEQYRDNSNNHLRPDLWRHSIHYYHPHLFAYPAFIPPLQPSGYVAHQSSISLCFMHPYHVVQGARPYPIDWVHAPLFLSSDLRTRIPSFGLHAHNFFELTYPCPSSLANALVFLSLGLRTYILLLWVTHPCLLWVTHPYCFVSFYVHPHICISLFLYPPIWLGTPIPWDYGTSWTLQVFSTPIISIGSMVPYVLFTLSCIGYPHSLNLSSP